jgi:CRISPR type III-A-associated RAMP protein Csm4
MDDNLALATTSFFAHSDTLFSALVNGYSMYNGGADSFVEKFKNRELKISSLFYYLSNGSNYIYFLPKPDFLAIHSPKTRDNLHKKRNRIKFVSIEVWKNGFEAEYWFDKDKYRIIQDEFVVTRAEYDLFAMSDKTNISKSVMRPKSPKRVPRGMDIHYQADLEIGNNSEFDIGWFFIYEVDEEVEKELKIATNVMAYTGIGGEKHNTGRSIKSKPEFDVIDDFETSDFWINVSLLNPINEDEFKEVKYYSTILRGGRKIPGGNAKVVKMIKEGALIIDEKVNGKLVDIGVDINEKTIFRNGISLLIPVKYEY